MIVYASGNSAALEKIIDARAAQKFADYVRAKLSAPKPGAPPSTAFATTDIADQLKRLAKLREQGILTEDEFQVQKRKLLG